MNRVIENTIGFVKWQGLGAYLFKIFYLQKSPYDCGNPENIVRQLSQ